MRPLNEIILKINVQIKAACWLVVVVAVGFYDDL